MTLLYELGEYTADIFDEDGSAKSPPLFEIVGTENGHPLYYWTRAVVYSTLGACELLGITPEALTRRAIEAELLHSDQDKGLVAGPVHCGQGPLSLRFHEVTGELLYLRVGPHGMTYPTRHLPPSERLEHFEYEHDLKARGRATIADFAWPFPALLHLGLETSGGSL